MSRMGVAAGIMMMRSLPLRQPFLGMRARARSRCPISPARPARRPWRAWMQYEMAGRIYLMFARRVQLLRDLPATGLPAPFPPVLFLFLIGAGPLLARDIGGTSFSAVYRRAAPAIVAITCEGKGGKFVGSGTIVDPVGLVLTSSTVVPEGAQRILVYLQGGARYRARRLTTVDAKEFSLIRIRSTGPFPALDLGDSDEVRLGERSLTLGNAVQSILRDDQVSLTAGIVSGSYTLPNRRPGSSYVGPVIETTASVHDYMDGGPLLNSRGEVIGVLCLNFSVRRWLGTAIPVNALKPLFGEYRRWHSDRRDPSRRHRYLGLELVETGGGDAGRRRVEISRVYDDGPAARAGLKRGLIVRSVNGQAAPTLDAYLKQIRSARAGTSVRLALQEPGTGDVSSKNDGDGRRFDVTLPPWAKL